MSPAGRDIRLLERLKDPLLILLGNPGAGVGHANHHIVLGLLAANDDSPLFGEAAGIAQQVDDHLTNPGLVAENRRQIRRDFGLQIQPPRLQRGP